MDAKKALLAKREKLVLSPKSAVSTGSTLLNLACTDNPHLGFTKGAYYYLVGDSTSGKTFLSLTCFAEATINEHFADYELVFDDVEGGAVMSIERFFGKQVARRMRAPSYDSQDRPVHSTTVESFYYHLRDLIKKGHPFIYVLDSQDALDSLSADKKFSKQKKASEEGEMAKGSFGDGKAKYHSENIRWVLSGIRKTKSILIIIGQTRDNIQPFTFEKKTRSGGRALRFYARNEIWTSVGKKIKKAVRGIKRTVGVECIAQIKKNRVTGKERVVTIPIYNSFGIDDVGSCVDYLIQNKHWSKNGDGIYGAEEFNFSGSKGEVIAYVEQNNLERKLRDIVGTVWSEIEQECQLNRKRRYE